MLAITVEAQRTISGTFSPAEEYRWLIAYKLNPGSQAYMADTAIKDGKFTLVIPENEKTGIYRLVYAVPQEEFYFDVIHNGKEDVELSFTTDSGLSFISSEENILFHDYFKNINDLEQRIISFYQNGKTSETEFLDVAENLRDTQKMYEAKSKDMVCHDFIIANHPYIPSGYEPIQAYIKNKKQHYFDYLDFKNPVLQGSGFLIDKVLNYVFTALPMKELSPVEVEKEIQNNVEEISAYTQDIDSSFSTRLYHDLWIRMAANNLDATSDFVYNNYLKALAVKTGNEEIINNIETYNRLRFGTIAPEISWENGKLSELQGASTYVLVFWSSTCSHCLDELPKLQEQLNGIADVKVVAVGLEDEGSSWKREAAKLTHFTHAISLGKWESQYAKLYAIAETPTYFILDQDKKIVAKPKDYKGVISFLEGKN